MRLGKTMFKKISYLEWGRLHFGRVKYDLARSNITPLTPKDLGITEPLPLFSRPDEADHEPLVQLLSKRYGVEPGRIMLTNGATSALLIAYMALLRPEDEILLEAPNYEPLYRMAQHIGVTVKIMERTWEDRFQIDLTALPRRIGKNTTAIVLTNLHNPSGVALDPDRMRTLGQIARDNESWVICSEVFLDNAFDARHRPACAYGSNLISINSLSKVYGLPGLRIGWIVAPEEAIERMRLVADYVLGGVSLPSAQIATVALERAGDILARSRRIVQRNIEHVEKWIAGRENLKWTRPDGGTVALIRLPPSVNAQDLSRLLREKYRTLVVPGDFFWTTGVIRISLGADEETFTQGLANVGKALDEIARSRR